MILLGVLCLAVAASAVPLQAPESGRNVIFSPKGVEANKNEVTFTITPQQAGFKLENGFFAVPKAPQLPPLYLFTFEKMKSKPSEGNKDGTKKDDGEGNKPGEGKDTEDKLMLVRIDVFTDVLEPLASLVLNGFSDLFSLFFSSDDEEDRSYYMLMKQ